jgi:hypothetical protein
MAEEDMMGERPPMPEMEGANMPRERMPMPRERMPERMPPEAVERLMRPSEEIGAVLVARLSNMSPEELRMLDSAITPQVAQVLMRLLPELAELVDQISQSGQGEDAMMGALGSM